MKKLKFYVCPDCGNIITAEAEAYMVLYAAWAVLSAVLAKKEPYGPFLIYCLSPSQIFPLNISFLKKQNYVSLICLTFLHYI